MQARRTALGFVPVLALARLLVACPGSLDEPDRFRFQIDVVTPEGGAPARGGAGGGGGEPPVPLCPMDVPSAVLQPTCATALCHDAAGAELSGGLRLDGGDVADQLVGAPVVTAACRDAGWLLRVDPGDPQGTGLLLHLLGEASPTCSQRMPSGQAPLSAYELECVRRWLENVIYDRSRRAGGPE